MGRLVGQGFRQSLSKRNFTMSLSIVLRVYAGHPVPALLMAHQLMAIKQCLQCGRKGIPEAIDGLDLAIDALFPHTDRSLRILGMQ